MADKIVLADTSILIDYFRKTDKSNSSLVLLLEQGYDFAISAISYYEIYSGTTPAQLPFWQDLLKQTTVLAFSQNIAQIAVDINDELKKKRKQIDMADLFIAATAITHNLPIATLNRRHFERIDSLNIME